MIAVNWLNPDLGAIVGQYPLLAVGAAFVAGLVTSIGPCTFAKAMAFAGYMGKEPVSTRARGTLLGASMVLGVTTSLVALGLLTGLAANVTRLGENVYYVAGGAIILMGLSSAGLLNIQIPVPRQAEALRRRFRNTRGPVGAYVLGLVFGLMLCPCCLPGLLSIYALTFAQGEVAYGIALVAAYTLGHHVPVLGVGIFAGTVKGLRHLQPWQSHVETALGSIMVVAGAFMLWIA